MLVPKYTAQANRGTGVSGQQMSFKVPGGALSQAAVAQGQSYTQLSQQAAQWSAVAYKMHRDTVVAGAVAKATASVDEAFNESQKQDITDPKYADKGGGILGFFNDAVTSIAKTAGSTSFDPLTNRRISAEVAGYVAGQRRTLDRYNAGRLVDRANATLNSGRDDAIRRAANALPSNWNGNEATLPTAVIKEIDDEEKRQADAAATGVKTAVSAGEANRNLRSEIAEYAVNTRITAAQTSEHMEELLDLLDDPKNFRWLDPDDRDRLVRSSRNKYQRFLNSEFRNEARERTAASQALKMRQSQRANGFYVQINRARQGGTDEAGAPVSLPTSEAILQASLEDNGRGLQDGHVEMFMNMIENTGPRHSHQPFVADLHTQVLDILDEEIGSDEKARRINDVIDRAAKQAVQGPQSMITIEDHLSFVKWARGAAKGQVNTSEIQRYRGAVLGAVNPKNEAGFPEDPRNVLREVDAMAFFDLQVRRGSTPSQAAMDTLRRFGITTKPIEEDGGIDTTAPMAPYYPSGIPSTVDSSVAGQPRLDLPSNPAKWDKNHVDAARQWMNANRAYQVFGRTAKERNQRFQRLARDLLRIEEYIKTRDRSQ